MIGVRVGEVHDYVPKCDRDKPKAEQTVFKVQFLTAEEQAKVRDMMYAVEGVGGKRKEQLKTGTVTLVALRMGLKGWTNFCYGDGEEITFDVANISAIPPAERDEIASHVRGEEGEEE